MKPESALRAKIKKHLKEKYGTECFHLHGSVYQEAGIPDLVCVRNGQMYLFEVKMPGKKAEPHQIAFLERYERAGAIVGVVDSITAVDNLLDTLK